MEEMGFMKEDWDNEEITLFKTYPKNSAMPAIIKGMDNRDIASMLIIADDETLELMRQTREGNLDIQVSTYIENVHEGREKNLVMRFDLFFPNAHSVYEGIIPEEPRVQLNEFVNTLKNTDVIDLIVTDSSRRAERVIPIRWEYERAKNTIEKLIQ